MFTYADLLPPHEAQYVVLPGGELLTHFHFNTRIQISKLQGILTGELFLLDTTGIAPQKLKI
eukprot:1356346-Amphidinium_carterae.1